MKEVAFASEKALTERTSNLSQSTLRPISSVQDFVNIDALTSTFPLLIDELRSLFDLKCKLTQISIACKSY